MKKFIALVFVLLLAVCFCRWTLAAQTEESLEQSQMSLSSQVRSALQDSRQQMITLEIYCDSLQEKLSSLEMRRAQDSEELTKLSMHLTDTMNSFRNASAELENLNLSLVLEKQKVAARNKILLIAGILLLINIAAKVFAFVCMTKGIKLPRWLDILI